MFENVGQRALSYLPEFVGVDTQHLSNWFWLPLHLWLIWRLLRPLRAQILDPIGRMARWSYAASLALMGVLISIQWGVMSSLRGVDLVMALVQTLVACLLMVRVAQTLFDFRHLIRSLSSSTSVMTTVLRQGNLQRIMAARDVIGIVFLFVLSNAIYGFLTRQPVAYGLNLWASALCLPPLILAFLWAIHTVNLKFRREARVMMLQGGLSTMGALDAMEKGLAELAMRSAASQLLMREVFMSEIFRIVATSVIALSSRL